MWRNRKDTGFNLARKNPSLKTKETGFLNWEHKCWTANDFCEKGRRKIYGHNHEDMTNYEKAARDLEWIQLNKYTNRFASHSTLWLYVNGHLYVKACYFIWKKPKWKSTNGLENTFIQTKTEGSCLAWGNKRCWYLTYREQLSWHAAHPLLSQRCFIKRILLKWQVIVSQTYTQQIEANSLYLVDLIQPNGTAELHMLTACTCSRSSGARFA